MINKFLLTKNETYFQKRILNIAIPAIVAQISYPLLGIVDTAVMGHFGSTAALAAIAIGASLLMVITNSVGFLRSSTLGLVAQAWGRGDFTALRDWALRSFILAIILSLIITLVTLVFVHYWSNDIFDETVQLWLKVYLEIRIWGIAATIFSFVILGVLLGCQDARAVLQVMLLTNLSNIALDFVFVAYFGMVADGVAYATVIAEYLGAFYGFFLVHKKFRGKNTLFNVQHFKIITKQISPFRLLLILNGHFFVRSTILSICFASLPYISAGLGVQFAAANAIMINLLHMASYTLDGLANASEALTGRSIGRSMPRLLKNILLRLHLWVFPVMSFFLIIFFFFFEYFVAVQTADDEIKILAFDLRFWLFFALVVSPWCMLLDGVFYGATLGKEVSIAMIIAASIFALSLWVSLPIWGNHGIWFSVNLFFIIRAVALYIQLPTVMQKSARV